MGDFHLDSNFHASLHRILDDVELSIDERLEQVIAMLARWDPTLLRNAARWEDEEIAKAFLGFVAGTGTGQGTRTGEERLLNALAGAAELKRRADATSIDVLRYAHLMRVRRELSDH